MHITQWYAAQARADIERFVAAGGSAEVLRVYDALETSVQRSDVWRCAALWLEGQRVVGDEFATDRRFINL